MTPGELALILTALGAGTLLKELFTWFRGLVSGFTSKNRREIDAAHRDLERAEAEVERLEGKLADARRDARECRDVVEELEKARRILRESLEVHRQVIIRAECLDSKDLPPFPSV